MASQYTEEYLDENQRRGGDAKGITPGSFLGNVLKGNAKRWLAGYRRALEKELWDRTNVDVIQGRSVSGATAYYRKDKE